MPLSEPGLYRCSHRTGGQRERDRYSDGDKGTRSQSVRLTGGNPVRMTDKACGEVDRDVSPITQKIYGNTSTAVQQAESRRKLTG